MLINLRPWQIPLTVFAGWINRYQLTIIEYLQEENRLLRAQVVWPPKTSAGLKCLHLP